MAVDESILFVGAARPRSSRGAKRTHQEADTALYCSFSETKERIAVQKSGAAL